MVVSFNTEALNGLCSEDQLELLDAVDQLRLQGIDHYISLPQIIVCGDQSSGKSSVLEAISGVPFPVKSNLCTRFPTELILRRSSTTDVVVSIIPHKPISGSRDEVVSAFHEKLDGFEGVPELIESAQMAMGISMQGKGFSKDLLRIEISGPHHPHLTIVDLPGLIHSETKQQSASDVELVRDVVQTYMKQPRSIILAVVSAKNDFANQIVLKLARSIDVGGKRTMGVITKPDTLVSGSGSEALYVSLAENKEVEFSLGWHVLKNLDSEKDGKSSLLHHRNEEEALFFSEGVWSTLPPSQLGVKELRTKLSDVLLRQVATELPSLIMEIDEKLEECTYLLHELGEPRATVHEQRLFLARIGMKFQHLINDAKNGTYTDPFFVDANTVRGFEQRLRAVIQQLNRDFTTQMLKHGHAQRISSTQDQLKQPGATTRDQFIIHVKELMRRTRGRELPGQFNSFVVADLFLKQSRPWKEIVVDHVNSCWAAAKRCLELAINSFADGPIAMNLLQNVVVPALDSLKRDVASKATELIDSQVACHPVTYNEQYLEATYRINDQRRGEYYKNIVHSVLGDPNSHNNMYINKSSIDTLIEQLSQRREPDAEQRAASEAVDCMEAYYNVALKRIIDDVAIEVIERKLLAALSEIFSPIEVLEMSDERVSTIAGESAEIRDKRTRLANQIESLNKGSETCRRFAGLRLFDPIPQDRDDEWSASILQFQEGTGFNESERESVKEPIEEDLECSIEKPMEEPVEVLEWPEYGKMSKREKKMKGKKAQRKAESVAPPEVCVEDKNVGWVVNCA
ncbi:P-loop containing nucleoside triphosphate hydrolase protein [Xylaria bambusicola]|uniref:P-loop containing nucleoside triphosphate hydrolase protein n=1 Tax=Xylaria bambusicola TaxID=326684 RepID=UPI00200898D5|nr:P-loop containing nucleoside triphosphate hydrolase protein [Xylaria bambusicola]KAI0509701.1 P-loop containing nucleoside triphosphate hydrolase protein [Xylaria bambusicola]